MCGKVCLDSYKDWPITLLDFPLNSPLSCHSPWLLSLAISSIEILSGPVNLDTNSWRVVRWQRSWSRQIHTAVGSISTLWKWKCQPLSHVWLLVTPWTLACKSPLSMGFSRQECWSGLPFPPPGDLPDPGIEHRFPALQADCLSSQPPGKSYLLSGDIWNKSIFSCIWLPQTSCFFPKLIAFFLSTISPSPFWAFNFNLLNSSLKDSALKFNTKLWVLCSEGQSPTSLWA